MFVFFRAHNLAVGINLRMIRNHRYAPNTTILTKVFITQENKYVYAGSILRSEAFFYSFSVTDERMNIEYWLLKLSLPRKSAVI